MTKVTVYVKMSATNDASGNPRRLYLVQAVDASKPNNGAERLAIIRENYDGNAGVRKRFPNAIALAEIEISPAEFKRWMNVKRTDEAYALERFQEGISKGVAALGLQALTKTAYRSLALQAQVYVDNGEGEAEAIASVVNHIKNRKAHTLKNA